MKYIYFCLAMLLTLGQVVSCSDSDDDSPHSPKIEAPSDSLPGMLPVKASDASVYLGTKDASAKAGERPQMKVSLNYDFLFARSEATCGEFNSLMKKSTGLVLDCSNDSLPATDVTYYDAVLFANERSKAEKKDTVYTYSKALFDAEKHCTNLEGFVFHAETNGYRLPTEAEWMLVAKTAWNPSEGWTAENSDYKLHKVCRKAASSDAVCDVIGNAMEWVNDWYGNFRDTSLINYVGAPDGGSLGQRVVKGGSYRNTLESIEAYNRGDIYTVTSSTRADYVGFRLAFGAIPDATWMGNDGKASSSRVVPVVSLSELRAIAGSHRVKLAFRNETKNIAFIDYSSGILTVTEIVDSLDAYHPEISPDGKKVAFCTKFEGLSDESFVYVRDLNAKGTNLVKLDVKNAVIPRWRVLDNGDTVIVYVSDAGDNKNDSKFKSASTWQVKFSKGKFGKPQKLFDGAYHGGLSEDDKLAVSGSTRLRARIAKSGSTIMEKARDTIWYNGEQTCNVSLAKDGSKRTLFLDFGGKKGSPGYEFIGKKENYSAHRYMFIVDSTGKVIQAVAAPDGYSFDHTEWASESSNLVVASLTNVNGAHAKIVLVNLADSSIVDLVEGDELWHPSLWILQNVKMGGVDLASDSAGVYFNEKGGEAAIILRYKMELLWKHKDEANVVILGSSRALNGVNPLQFSDKFFAINMANVPNMTAVSDYLASHYVFPHVKKLKYIVISLDIDLWYHDEQSSYNFFSKEYKEYLGYTYDEHHDFWKDGVPDKMAEMTENSMGVEYYALNFRESRGYNVESCGSWEKSPAIDNDSTWKSSKSSNYYSSFNHLNNILMMAENYGVYVIGVVFPQSPGFKKTGAFGRYGLRRSETPALLQELQDLSKVYPHFIFVDENKMGDHDYKDSMAQNRDHLCSSGAERMTTRLDSLLKTLK